MEKFTNFLFDLDLLHATLHEKSWNIWEVFLMEMVACPCAVVQGEYFYQLLSRSSGPGFCCDFGLHSAVAFIVSGMQEVQPRHLFGGTQEGIQLERQHQCCIR